MQSKNKLLILKFLSLFSVVRGYNIVLVVLAQYLASIYIFAPHKSLSTVLFDPYLFLIVLASAFSIASGYIINDFYDAEKDLINRPHKTMIDNYLGQRTKLSVYFVLNLITVILASAVSFRAVVFFSVYLFFLWFYSHKLKKYPLVGNITATSLAITPFFAVFIYYKNFDFIIFVHATYLFLVLFMRDLLKDLENIKGDFVQQYNTVPVVYGERLTKGVITLAYVLTIVPIYFLLSDKVDVGYMRYYFVFSSVFLLFFVIVLWKAQRTLHYTILHLGLKMVLTAGVFSILLIDPQVVLERVF